MRLTTTPWGPYLQREALKFWFYSISVSILLSLYRLATLEANDQRTEQSKSSQISEKPSPTVQTRSKKSKTHQADSNNNDPVVSEKASSTIASQKSQRRKIYKQLLTDCCDFVIPISAVNWVQSDPIVVGLAGAASSILVGWDVWTSVNRQK